jgi:hypothetical protein
MRYILIYKAKRKNAKRHIWGRYNTIEECKRNATNNNYEFSIYNSKWDLIEEIKKEEKQ